MNFSIYNRLRRKIAAMPETPEPNKTRLPGSGVVPVVVLPYMVNDSDGIVPTELSEAEDGPEFSSQKIPPSSQQAFSKVSQ